jgi:hypothetical protein
MGLPVFEYLCYLLGPISQQIPKRCRATALQRRGISMLSIWLVMILVATPSAPSQSCNPAVVDYIVRDEKGQVLSAADLKSIYELLPKEIGNAGVNTSQVSFAEDKKTYYWLESVEWEKGAKVPALEFANAATCTLHLEEVTLTYHGKKMRLIFNIDIARNQHDRRPVIDSVPFQEGTFTLDLTGWTHDPEKLIPSTHWLRVKGTKVS